MNFDDIFRILRNRAWQPMSDMDAVDMIIEAHIKGNIDDDEKEYLLDMI